MRIRIQLVLADTDSDPDMDLDLDPMDRARNSECFTFLKFENPSSGLKVISFQSWVLFYKKWKKLADSISKNQGNIRKLAKFAKNYNFWAKNLDPMKKIITFEPLYSFSNFKKVKHSELCQEFNENIRGYLDPDQIQKTDPDPAKKSQIHNTADSTFWQLLM